MREWPGDGDVGDSGLAGRYETRCSARRQDALLRPRLMEALERALERTPLILISAPAGAGKTTLLADLPGAFPKIVWSWLLLDAEDNDPSRFAAALLASLTIAGITIEEDSARPCRGSAFHHLDY